MTWTPKMWRLHLQNQIDVNRKAPQLDAWSLKFPVQLERSGDRDPAVTVQKLERCSYSSYNLTRNTPAQKKDEKMYVRPVIWRHMASCWGAYLSFRTPDTSLRLALACHAGPSPLSTVAVTVSARGKEKLRIFVSIIISSVPRSCCNFASFDSLLINLPAKLRAAALPVQMPVRRPLALQVRCHSLASLEAWSLKLKL